MSIQPIRVPVVEVGTPSPEFRSNHGEWEAVEVRFHGFENLPAARGNAVISPEFTCAGHRWRLKLCPGGNSNSDDGMVALDVCNRSEEGITVRYACSVKTKDRTSKFDFASKRPRSFAPRGTGNAADGIYANWGSPNFATRTDIINALVEGALIIEVQMNEPDKAVPSMPFIPENPLSKIILGKFMDEESADIVFEVGSGGAATAENKKAKTSPTTFHAHRFILEDCAPVLAASCKPGEDSTAILIPDVQPAIFHFLLYSAYGGKVAEGDLKANAKDIINAADKYEVTHLKLEAEAIFVASTDITVENVIELLLFANDKNCALLKEAAMDFLVEEREEVMKNVSFENVPSHLMKDLLAAVGMDGSMRVSALRKRLHERGLDVDGSREAMIARLEEHS